MPLPIKMDRKIENEIKKILNTTALYAGQGPCRLDPFPLHLIGRVIVLILTPVALAVADYAAD
jgi:hypothetical protein